MAQDIRRFVCENRHAIQIQTTKQTVIKNLSLTVARSPLDLINRMSRTEINSPNRICVNRYALNST